MISSDLQSCSHIDLPLMIEIEPVHSCNLRCFMCHVPHERLTYERIEVRRLLDALEVFRGKGTWVSVGSSYEPTMHPDFVRLIHGLSGLGMNIEITTNGTLLYPHVTDQLAGANINQVYFSFDGIRKETYESIRKNASFETTVSNLVYFREKFRQTGCYINYVISRSNIDEISDSVVFWERHNFDTIGYISMVQRSDDPRVNNESIEHCMDKIREQFEQAASLIVSNDFRISITAAAISNMDFLKSRYPDNLIKSNRADVKPVFNPRSQQSGPYPGMPVDCRSPFTFARIFYSGNVILCNDLFPIGNVYQNDFQSIWNGEYAAEIRLKIMNNSSICHHCDYFRFCLNAGAKDYTDLDDFYSEGMLQKIRAQESNEIKREALQQAKDEYMNSVRK